MKPKKAMVKRIATITPIATRNTPFTISLMMPQRMPNTPKAVRIIKPHIANILMRRGIPGTRTEVINRYLEFGVDNRIPAAQAIRAIRRSGGIAVWAHPLGGENEKHMGRAELESRLDILQTLGIQGLESYYSRYDEAEISMLIEMARERGLLVSGGSDFHGKNKNVSIGELNTAGKPVYDSDLSLIEVLRKLGK